MEKIYAVSLAIGSPLRIRERFYRIQTGLRTCLLTKYLCRQGLQRQSLLGHGGKLRGNEFLIPVKAVKGMTKVKKQRNKTADDIYSAVVSLSESLLKFFSFAIIQMLIKNHYFCCTSKNLENSTFFIVSQEDTRRQLL